MRKLLPDASLDKVAYAIGKVIARRVITEDPSLRRLDALGRTAAEHEMALNMVPQLQAEAAAALAALLELRADELEAVELGTAQHVSNRPLHEGPING